jgi:ribosome maturation factor RimP
VGSCPLFLFSGADTVPQDPRIDVVRSLAERVARSYGLELFDVQLRREAPGLVLRIIIDRPAQYDAGGNIVVDDPDDGIGIEECQHVSRDLDVLLDVEEAMSDGQYTLEVSSPGLDRPLRSASDYQRFAGRLAKVVTSEPVSGQTHFEGRLGGLDAGDVLIQTGRTKTARLPLTLISRARLEVEF